jgi:S-adenosylmethionine:tRNA ribosyltransferase-isomerase
MQLDHLSTYDYELPEHLIAKQPTERRDQSRLLVLDRAAQTIEHASIADLPNYLRAGDCIVLNDTRVLPARLLGIRAATGGKWEGLFLSATNSGTWLLIAQTRGKVLPGEVIRVESIHGPRERPALELRLMDRHEEGVWEAVPSQTGTPETILPDYGTLPLPPYMQRKVAVDSDWERYQTVYADRLGSVAAPTAGLHFTPELLQRCEAAGVSVARVTLHVGIGTFKPISVENLAEHKMHSEWCEVSTETVQLMTKTRQQNGRIVAIGTTSVRTLESASQSGVLQPWSGHTDLFIRPPYQFKTIDCLLTNFHLPKSTLLVLVSTLAGYDFVRRGYQSAIEANYRFFSYGDAMLIL